MKRLFAVGLIVATLAVPAGRAFADDPHSNGSTGQPGKTCGTAGATTLPGGGQSSNSPGSPFQGGTADSHYNSTNSQYDVACFQNSQPHP